MKKLLLLTAITLLTSSAFGACTIELKAKKAGAKTNYTLQGESISQKVIEKLSSQCKFNVSLMTRAELKEFKIKRLKKQLAKLQK